MPFFNLLNFLQKLLVEKMSNVQDCSYKQSFMLLTAFLKFRYNKEAGVNPDHIFFVLQLDYQEQVFCKLRLKQTKKGLYLVSIIFL